MKKLLVLFVSLFVMNVSLVFAEESDIVGIWANPTGNQIKVYKEKNVYVGELIKLVEPIYPEGHRLEGQEKVDIENPDTSKRDRKLLGLRILWNFVYENGIYKNGKIYDPKSGKTYYCKMEIKENTLKIRGSIDKFGLVGRTEEWRKVK